MSGKKWNEKFLLLHLIAAVIAVVVICVSFRRVDYLAEVIERGTRNEMLALGRLAAGLTTADELDEYQEAAGLGKAGDGELQAELARFAGEFQVAFVYFVKLDHGSGQQQLIVANAYGDSGGPDQRAAVPEAALAKMAPVYYRNGEPSDFRAVVVRTAGDIDAVGRELYRLPVFMAVIFVMMLFSFLILLSDCRSRARSAEAAGRSGAMFLSNISHEIRTPMNAVVGLTQLAGTCENMKQVNHYLARISDAAEHILCIVNDILDLSKLESAKFEIVPEETSLERIIKRVTTVINVKVGEKEQIFLINVDSMVPDSIVTDALRLSQVLTNLLSNAVKFTPEGGSIHLEVYHDGISGDGMVLRFVVRDTGIGISKEQQTRLFEAFSQADATIARQYGGTGLGLMICKDIVGLMGGSIGVSSELGKGSEFTFTIKVKPGGKPDVNTDNSTLDWKRFHFLMVSGLAGEREAFGNIFRKFGCACEFADTGERAMERLDAGLRYTIVFIDFFSIELDTFEWTGRIKQKYPEVLLVSIMSDTFWRNNRDKAKEAGSLHYLTRPFFPSEIVACVNEVLGGTSETAAKLPPRFEKDIYHGRRILIAEDMEINRQILTALLKTTGAELTFAADGEQAVAAFTAGPDYDLVVLDIQMPVMDGYQAARKIRDLGTAKSASIPILAMTASISGDDIGRCMEAGMDAHVSKPINLEEMIPKFNQYLLGTDIEDI